MLDARVDQSELARRVGCTPAAINQILTGRTNISKLLPDIARELRVAVDWLRGKTDDANREAPPQLTAQEHRLLTTYRRLPAQDQAALRLLIQRMAGKTSPDE
jgi:transcriptional regulator with XRE-family HTH domain